MPKSLWYVFLPYNYTIYTAKQRILSKKSLYISTFFIKFGEILCILKWQSAFIWPILQLLPTNPYSHYSATPLSCVDLVIWEVQIILRYLENSICPRVFSAENTLADLNWPRGGAKCHVTSLPVSRHAPADVVIHIWLCTRGCYSQTCQGHP